jgi:Bacterial alpha-L-rhamnosidase C-terminal domain
LKNIRQRFLSLYGERARATWGSAEGQFKVELVLPLSTVATLSTASTVLKQETT